MSKSQLELGEWKKILDNKKLSRKEVFYTVKRTAKELEDQALKKIMKLKKGFEHTVHKHSRPGFTSQTT